MGRRIIRCGKVDVQKIIGGEGGGIAYLPAPGADLTDNVSEKDEGPVSASMHKGIREGKGREGKTKAEDRWKPCRMGAVEVFGYGRRWRKGGGGGWDVLVRYGVPYMFLVPYRRPCTYPRYLTVPNLASAKLSSAKRESQPGKVTQVRYLGTCTRTR